MTGIERTAGKVPSSRKSPELIIPRLGPVGLGLVLICSTVIPYFSFARLVLAFFVWLRSRSAYLVSKFCRVLFILLYGYLTLSIILGIFFNLSNLFFFLTNSLAGILGALGADLALALVLIFLGLGLKKMRPVNMERLTPS